MRGAAEGCCRGMKSGRPKVGGTGKEVHSLSHKPTKALTSKHPETSNGSLTWPQLCLHPSKSTIPPGPQESHLAGNEGNWRLSTLLSVPLQVPAKWFRRHQHSLLTLHYATTGCSWLSRQSTSPAAQEQAQGSTLPGTNISWVFQVFLIPPVL